MTTATTPRTTAGQPAPKFSGPKPLKYRLLSLGLRTVGRLSDGIALGYRHGFDSGTMLDYVYENRPRGWAGIGLLLDWIYLNQIGWQGIRARRAVLEDELRQAIVRRRAEGRPIHILDVAGGPGRYLLSVLQAENSSAVTATCRDLDPQGLEHGRKLALALGVTTIRYEQGDALDPDSLRAVQPRPGIVVVSGLYELIARTPLIERALHAIHALLPEDGTLIFTSQVAHPQLELIAQTLVNRAGEPWMMTLRGLDEVEGWACDAGFVSVRSQLEPHKLFAITVARKAP